MPFRYKHKMLPLLKQAGFSTSRLRKEKIIGESMVQRLRQGELVSWATLETVCGLLDCQPGDILEYVKDWDAPQAAEEPQTAAEPEPEEEMPPEERELLERWENLNPAEKDVILHMLRVLESR